MFSWVAGNGEEICLVLLGKPVLLDANRLDFQAHEGLLMFTLCVNYIMNPCFLRYAACYRYIFDLLIPAHHLISNV